MPASWWWATSATAPVPGGPQGGGRCHRRRASGPGQYPTIQAAVDAADPGDLVLVDRGVYREEVTVTTPSLTIRGVDRNETIIDGEFVRGNGIAVLADGVAIENLTARNAVLNGFYWTGVTGFRGSWLTAYNNGDYGIYAFDARDGLFEHSYASGSPDSGFYIGECYPCRIVIRDVIAEHNAIGYSGTNSGGHLYVVSSIWRNNRSGLAPAVLDLELNPPQRETVIAANLIVGNSNRARRPPPRPSPTAMASSWRAGSATWSSEHHRRSRAARHPGHADVHRNWCARATSSARTDGPIRPGRSGAGRPGELGNCFAGNRTAVAAPAGLELFRGCGGLRLPLGFDPLPLVSIVGYRGFTVAHRSPDRRPAGAAAPARMPEPHRPGAPCRGRLESLRFDAALSATAGRSGGRPPRHPADRSADDFPEIAGRALSSATFWLIPLLFLAWVTGGRRRPIRSGLGALALYLAVLAVAAVIYGRFG